MIAKIVHVRFKDDKGEIIDRDINLDTPCQCPHKLCQLAKTQILSEVAIGIIKMDTLLYIHLKK